MVGAEWLVYLVVVWVVGKWLWVKAIRRVPKEGTVVLITGGCGGIGTQISLQFARQHCTIVAWDVNESGFPALISAVERAGGTCTCIKCDVSDESQVVSATKQTVSTVGRVDILVCNAGVAQKQRFFDLSAAQFRSTFETNFFGCVSVTRAFLNLPMPPRRVVVVSSVLAFGTLSRVSEYAASKHALHAFVSTVRIEAKERGLNVAFTEVCPWHVSTQLFAGWKVRWNLLPPVSPQYVAEALFEAVCTEQSLAVTPWYYWHFFSLLSYLPIALYDWLTLFLVPT